jgi:hypothetical protein
MRLRDWLNESKFSVTNFVEEVRLQRTMVHQYFAGGVPRVRIITWAKVITKGPFPTPAFTPTQCSGGWTHLRCRTRQLPRAVTTIRPAIGVRIVAREVTRAAGTLDMPGNGVDCGGRRRALN